METWAAVLYPAVPTAPHPRESLRLAEAENPILAGHGLAKNSFLHQPLQPARHLCSVLSLPHLFADTVPVMCSAWTPGGGGGVLNAHDHIQVNPRETMCQVPLSQTSSQHIVSGKTVLTHHVHTVPILKINGSCPLMSVLDKHPVDAKQEMTSTPFSEAVHHSEVRCKPLKDGAIVNMYIPGQW